MDRTISYWMMPILILTSFSGHQPMLIPLLSSLCIAAGQLSQIPVVDWAVISALCESDLTLTRLYDPERSSSTISRSTAYEGQTMADQNLLKCLKFEPVYLTDSSKEHWAQLRQWLFRVQLHIDIPYKKNCLIAKQASVLHYLFNISLF